MCHSGELEESYIRQLVQYDDVGIIFFRTDYMYCSAMTMMVNLLVQKYHMHIQLKGLLLGLGRAATPRRCIVRGRAWPRSRV